MDASDTDNAESNLFESELSSNSDDEDPSVEA